MFFLSLSLFTASPRCLPVAGLVAEKKMWALVVAEEDGMVKTHKGEEGAAIVLVLALPSFYLWLPDAVQMDIVRKAMACVSVRVRVCAYLSQITTAT